jgi:hypothetical protein
MGISGKYSIKTEGKKPYRKAHLQIMASLIVFMAFNQGISNR